MPKRTAQKDNSEVDESKKAKPDLPAEETTEDKPHQPADEKVDPKPLAYLQIIVTGSKECGKSSLVCSFLGQLLPSSRTEFLSKQYLHIVPENNQTVMIWDLDSRNEYTEYRKQSYREADIAFLCFDIRKASNLMEGNGSRLEEVLDPWIAELDEHCSKIPIILVGLKGDLKSYSNVSVFDKVEIDRALETYPRFRSYKEVSARTNKNEVKVLFEEAIASIAAPKPKVMFSTGGFEILGHRPFA